MKCEFCDSELEYETTTCKHCGAPCQFIKRPAEKSAQVQTKRIYANNAEEADSENPDDLRPISNVDLSFLKKKQEARRKAAQAPEGQGCTIVLAVILLMLVIAILIGLCLS